MKEIALFGVLAITLALPTPPARGDEVTHAGQWTIQQSEHNCVALRQDEHGTVIAFTLYTAKAGDDRLALFLAKDEWRVPRGASYPVTVTIDGVYTARATAEDIGNNDVEIDLPMKQAFPPFMRGKMLTVAGPKSKVVTSLVDMTQAAGAIIDCFRRVLDRKSPSNPFQP